MPPAASLILPKYTGIHQYRLFNVAPFVAREMLRTADPDELSETQQESYPCDMHTA